MTLTPYASASARAVHAGERRQQRRVGVDEPAAEARRGTSSPTSFMKPAEHHQVGLVARRPARPAPRSQRLAVGVVLDPHARTSGCRPARPGPAPRCRRGRRRRRPPRRRTPGRRRRRAAPAGWCRPGDEHDEARGAAAGTRPESRRSAAPRGGRSVAATSVIARPPSRPPMPNAVIGVHEHVERQRPDVAHPARPDRAAGHRGEQPKPHAGEDAAGAAAQRALLPAHGRVPALRPGGADDRDQHRQGDQPRPSSRGRAVVGQRGQQREHRQRAERDGGGRDQRAGADGEAGAEQVGAGEEDGVGQHRAAQHGEQSGVAGVGVQLGHHVGGGAEVEHERDHEGQRGDAEPEPRGSRGSRSRRRGPTAAVRRPRSPPGPSRRRAPVRRRPAQSSSDHSTTRGVLGSVAGVAASVVVTHRGRRRTRP